MSKNLDVARMEGEIAFKEKEMAIAYALWFFVGILGVHRFYLGRTKTGILQLIMGTVGALLIFPLFILGIWWLFDAYFVHKYVNEYNLDMQNKKLAHLKAAQKEVEAEA